MESEVRDAKVFGMPFFLIASCRARARLSVSRWSRSQLNAMSGQFPPRHQEYSQPHRYQHDANPHRIRVSESCLSLIKGLAEKTPADERDPQREGRAHSHDSCQ